MARTLASMGYAYINWQQPKEAIAYLTEAEEIFTRLAEKAPLVFKKELNGVQLLLRFANEAQ
ncbi:MAG: hypothetical protein LM517_07440 [Nitrosomonas sp.]|nr:hypothetical protein [Nitrosomonas sp.]